MGNLLKSKLHLTMYKLIAILALIGMCQTACTNGYWAFHTTNTLNDPAFGPWNCLNGAVPCGSATSATAAKKILKDSWVAAGGKSYKYMANGYCTGEKSMSNTWTTIGNVVWKFSLTRRLGKKDKKDKRILGKGKGKGKKDKKRDLKKSKGKKDKKDKRILGKGKKDKKKRDLKKKKGGKKDKRILGKGKKGGKKDKKKRDLKKKSKGKKGKGKGKKEKRILGKKGGKKDKKKRDR